MKMKMDLGEAGREGLGGVERERDILFLAFYSNSYYGYLDLNSIAGLKMPILLAITQL